MEPLEITTRKPELLLPRGGMGKSEKIIIGMVIVLVAIGLLIILRLMLARRKNISTVVVTPAQVQAIYKNASDTYDQAFVNGITADQKNQLLSQSQQNLDAVLKDQPHNVDALNKIVSIFLLKGDYLSAENHLLQYTPSNPNDTYLINLLASIYGQEGNYSQAEAYYEKSLSIDPNNVNTYLDFGVLYLKENKNSEAVSLLQTGLQKLPGNVGLQEKLDSLTK